jgi:hypothetical protein
MTFGQLRRLARSGLPPSTTIRRVCGSHVAELDVGPRRWILISKNSKRPRRFQHLDGAANAMRLLGAQSMHLELGGAESSSPPFPPNGDRS